MTHDLNPTAWGAQDRFQAHFIVKTDTMVPVSSDNFLVKAKVSTKGHFADKQVSAIKWIGSTLAESMNDDSELASMVTKLSVDDANITVEPTKSGIRVHGPWKGGYDFTISKELFAVYDRIAFHIRKNLGLPPVQS